MIDREKKYSDELTACRKNIERIKKLIEYHKNTVKTLEAKEKSLSERLEKEKVSSFCKLLSRKGYDIDAFRSFVESGEFSDRYMETTNETVMEKITIETEDKKV